MSIIIRLQNLPLEANSLDIRRFFQGLHIPDGGVHIVGGENGDAFIAFGSDEDARQAMGHDGNSIKNSRVKLLLSSRNEMQRVIDNVRVAMAMNINPALAAASSGAGIASGVTSGGVVGGIAGGVGQIKKAVQGPYVQQQQTVPQMAPKAVISNQAGPPAVVYSGQQGGYPGQQQQVPPPQVNLPPASISQSNIGGGYGQAKMQPNEASYGQRQQPPYRARSRSRSPPPPTRNASSLAHEQTGPHGGQSHSMQSGLMGSLQQHQQHQQPPPPSQMYGQNNNVVNNGQQPPNSGANNGMPYGDSNNANYYTRQHGYGPEGGGPKYGDDRWNSAPQGPPGMMQGGGQGDNFQSAYPRAGNGHQPYQQYPQAPQSSGAMAPPPPPQQGSSANSSHAVGSGNSRLFELQLWNLPTEIRAYDLLNFFSPLYLPEENVKIFYDERGLASGMAIVGFATARDMDTALAYSGRYIFGKSITIRPINDLAGGSAPAGHGANNNGNQFAQQGSSGHALPPPSHHAHNNEPPYSMEPNVNYPPQGAFRASPPMEMPYTNTRPPPGPPSFQGGPPGPQQRGFPGPHQGPHQGPHPRGPPGGPKPLVLFMKGLPFSNCTERDVQDFFQPIPLVNIEIEKDGRGKASGNAYVEFERKLDYVRAKTYNMRHMGHRYIELIPLHKLAKMAGPGGPPMEHRGGGGGAAQHRPPTFCISVRGLSPLVTSQDLKNYFGANGARPFAVHIMLTPDQRNAGEAFLEFADKEGFRRALKQDGATLMGRDRLLIQQVPYEMVMGAIGAPKAGPPGGGPPGPAFGPGGPPQGGFKGGPPAPRNIPPPPIPFEDPASTLIAVDCSNKAVEEDYCAFFDKFAITPDRVKLSVNGRTGHLEAAISFYSQPEAAEAMRTSNGKFFFGRTMKLEFL